MMNFVPAMQPAPVVQPVPTAQVVAQPPQGQYPSYPPYPGVQNYNSAGGITYYAPQQAPPRPIVSQRRHKNAIPIMAPPERANRNAHSRSGNGSASNVGSINNDTNNNSDHQQVMQIISMNLIDGKQ